MKKVYIEGNSYIYNKKNFPLYEVEKLKDELGKKVNAIILEENIKIKTYYDITLKKKDKQDIIEKLIRENFNENEDFLYHYLYNNRKKRLIIYSVKKGLMVEKLLRGCKEVVVEPVQFLIKRIVENKIGKKGTLIYLQHERKMYLIKCVDKDIVESYVLSSITEVENILSNIDGVMEFISSKMGCKAINSLGKFRFKYREVLNDGKI